MMDAHSLPPRERRWRDLVEKNIGWIVVAASIWLAAIFHFRESLDRVPCGVRRLLAKMRCAVCCTSPRLGSLRAPFFLFS
jgi:hypothetical protein